MHVDSFSDVAQDTVLILPFFKRIKRMAPSFSKLEDESQVLVDQLIHHMLASNPSRIKFIQSDAL
jgi:hypothetical protein